MSGEGPPLPSPPARVLAWNVAILAGTALSGVALLRGFLEKLSALPPGWAGGVRAGILGIVLLLVAGSLLLVLFWRRSSPRGLTIAAGVLFAVLGVAPAVAKTVGRLKAGSHSMVLDSVLQVEVAAGMLAHGRNPYRETFRGTEAEAWHRGVDRTSLDHLVYPPLPMLLVLPFREVSLRIVGAFDSRFLLIPMMIAAFIVCCKAWRDDPWRPGLLAIAFLNPLLLPNLHVGRWDTLVLTLWILALWASTRGRHDWMAAGLALAALAKTTVAPAALFGAVLVSRRQPENLRRWILVYAGVGVAVLMPFVLWDGSALFDDLFAWTAGYGDRPAPVVDSGPYGLAGMLLALGWVSGPLDSFPLWLIQWPATLAVAAWGVLEVRRERSLLAFGVATTLTAATYLFFNRFSDPAYVGSLLAMAVVAAGFDRVPPAAPPLDPVEASG